MTGSTGCLGGHVARHLVDLGHPIRALVLPAELDRARALLPGRTELITGNVLESDTVAAAVQDCAAVVHLAGVAGVIVADPAMMMAVNHLGTRNVARSCLDQGIRLVHVSSASAVGLADEQLIDENFTADDGVTHPYPVSKRAGEQAVRELVAEGLDAVILAPAAVLASGGDPANTWSGLPVALAAGRLPLAPPGGFGFVSAATFVDAVVAALEQASSGARYLVVDENLSYLDLFGLVAAELGVRPPRGTVPPRLVNFMLALGDRLRSVVPKLAPRIPLSSDAMPLLCRQVRFDGRRAEAELGLTPRAVSVAVRELVRGGHPTDSAPSQRPRGETR